MRVLASFFCPAMPRKIRGGERGRRFWPGAFARSGLALFSALRIHFGTILAVHAWKRPARCTHGVLAYVSLRWMARSVEESQVNGIIVDVSIGVKRSGAARRALWHGERYGRHATGLTLQRSTLEQRGTVFTAAAQPRKVPSGGRGWVGGGGGGRLAAVPPPHSRGTRRRGGGADANKEPRERAGKSAAVNWPPRKRSRP